MASQYSLEHITWQHFEELVIKLCRVILGQGAKTFSDGPDGGRDSWFEGTAQKYPSTIKSWQGRFVIQAKHTTLANASCSDNNFGSLKNSQSTIVKEVARLRKLNQDKTINNYLLFTNRKLAGNKYSELCNFIKKESGIANVDIIGSEELDVFLNENSEIPIGMGLYKFQYSLSFREKQIRDVIVLFEEKRKDLPEIAEKLIEDFSAIPKEDKNRLNNLGREYFTFIQSHSLKYFDAIEKFLKDPQNKRYSRFYANTVSDLNAKIIIERNNFAQFESLLEKLIDYVVDKNEEELNEISNMVRVFFHFMYFNCDIGRKK